MTNCFLRIYWWIIQEAEKYSGHEIQSNVILILIRCAHSRWDLKAISFWITLGLVVLFRPKLQRYFVIKIHSYQTNCLSFYRTQLLFNVFLLGLTIFNDYSQKNIEIRLFWHGSAKNYSVFLHGIRSSRGKKNCKLFLQNWYFLSKIQYKHPLMHLLCFPFDNPKSCTITK